MLEYVCVHCVETSTIFDFLKFDFPICRDCERSGWADQETSAATCRSADRLHGKWVKYCRGMSACQLSRAMTDSHSIIYSPLQEPCSLMGRKVKPV